MIKFYKEKKNDNKNNQIKKLIEMNKDYEIIMYNLLEKHVENLNSINFNDIKEVRDIDIFLGKIVELEYERNKNNIKLETIIKSYLFDEQ